MVSLVFFTILCLIGRGCCFQGPCVLRSYGKNDYLSVPSRNICHRRKQGLRLHVITSKLHAVHETIETVGAKTRTAVAGKISIFLSKLVVDKVKRQRIANSLGIHVDPTELVTLILLSWASVPIAHAIWNIIHKSDSDEKNNISEQNPETSSSTWGDLIRWVAPPVLMRNKFFSKSLIYQVADHVSQIAKLGLIVYAFDLAVIFISDLGFSVAYHLHHIFPKTIYTIWIAGRLRIFKRYLLKRSLGSSPQVYLYDRLINLIIYISAVTVLLEIYSIEWGIALSSLFAFGGLSTVVFGLASKDLVTQLVNSIALTASNNFQEGESIIIGNDKSAVKGVVVKVGWLHTLIRGDDETILKIPNTQLVNQRVSNLSRVPYSQVKQTLRFKHDDIDKIPKLVTSIKDEIKTTFSDSLITEGRPCRVHFRDIQPDHLEVVCDFRFNLPPTGDKYYDNRQQVIETIARVVKENGMTFE